jgi:hypothetical protein
MKSTSGGARPAAAGLLCFALLAATSALAQEPEAASYIVPSPDRQCDEFNRSWKVTSQHTYRSIKVVVRWTAVGAKQMQEEFILAPGATRALGCAADLEIVSAEIMDF